VTDPKAYLVTGGGSGIGAAVTSALATAGHKVAICGRRADALRAVAAKTGAVDLVCDVADGGQVTELVGVVTSTFGRLDGLVLNAGIIAPGGVASLSAEDFTEMVAINLTGPFLVAKAALPHLLAARGAIVSVASVAALRAASDMGGYAATKAGLAMMTQSLAVDHAHVGLRANVVCPGWTLTPMTEEFANDPAGIVRALQTMPLRKVARTSDVAMAVLYLASSRLAGHVTGQILTVAGGMEGRLLYQQDEIDPRQT